MASSNQFNVSHETLQSPVKIQRTCNNNNDNNNHEKLMRLMVRMIVPYRIAVGQNVFLKGNGCRPIDRRYVELKRIQRLSQTLQSPSRIQTMRNNNNDKNNHEKLMKLSQLSSKGLPAHSAKLFSQRECT